MPTSSDDLDAVQKLIHFCPLCGYESTKEFNDYTDMGGDWVCENCEETVEAYLIDRDEDDENEFENKNSSSTVLFWLLLAILVGIYFFM